MFTNIQPHQYIKNSEPTYFFSPTSPQPFKAVTLSKSPLHKNTVILSCRNCTISTQKWNWQFRIAWFNARSCSCWSSVHMIHGEIKGYLKALTDKHHLCSLWSDHSDLHEIIISNYKKARWFRNGRLEPFMFFQWKLTKYIPRTNFLFDIIFLFDFGDKNIIFEVFIKLQH